MYLSQLILNPRSRQVRSELARAYELHRTVMSGFSALAADERVLYRLDVSARDGIPHLLVQSRHKPDWSKLVGKGDYFLDLEIDNPQVRAYDPQLAAGQWLAFRLLANPTRSVKTAAGTGELGGDRTRGKRVSLAYPEDQAAWLERKGVSAGFRVRSLRILNLGEQRMAVPDRAESIHSARHWAVRFDGELEVTDTGLFRAALENGIGSAKGFGYGLLSVAVP